MKNALLLFIVFFFTCVCIAQKKNLTPPESKGFEIKYRKGTITPIYSVYVNKNKEIYFEHIKLDTITQLGDSIYKYKKDIPIEQLIDLKVFIYADKNLPYAVVDAVKSELSRAYIGAVYYKTNHVEDIESGIGLRNQKAFTYITEPIEEGTIVETIEGIGKHPIDQLGDDLYNKDFKKARESLENFNYTIIEFTSSKTMKIGIEKIALSDHDAIFNAIKNFNLILTISDPSLSYADYFKNTSTLIKVFRTKGEIPRLEISNTLLKVLKENNFKI